MGQATQNQFGMNEAPQAVSAEDVRRMRLRCAEAAVDDRELRDFLEMLGIGAEVVLRIRPEVRTA